MRSGGGGGGINLDALICSHDWSSKHQLSGLVWFFSLSADDWNANRFYQPTTYLLEGHFSIFSRTYQLLLLTERKEGESGRAKFLTLNAQQLKLEAIPVLIKIWSSQL